MAESDECRQPEEHHLHFCTLESAQMHEQIRKMFEAPRYVCRNCGARVHAAENVCAPKPID